MHPPGYLLCWHPAEFSPDSSNCNPYIPAGVILGLYGTLLEILLRQSIGQLGKSLDLYEVLREGKDLDQRCSSGVEADLGGKSYFLQVA